MWNTRWRARLYKRRRQVRQGAGKARRFHAARFSESDRWAAATHGEKSESPAARNVKVRSQTTTVFPKGVLRVNTPRLRASASKKSLYHLNPA